MQKRNMLAVLVVVSGVMTYAAQQKALVVAQETASSTQQSCSTATALTAEQQKQLDLLQKKLQLLWGDPHWPERRKLIQQAIEQHGLHPDAIKYQSDKWPLYEAVRHGRADEADYLFAKFLLQHGASAVAVCDYNKTPLLFFAKTVLMAKLLIKYGAQDEVKKPGLLSNVILHRYEAELLDFYCFNGASLEPDEVGETCLHRLSLRKTTDLNDKPLFWAGKIILFLQNGASLHSRMNYKSPVWNNFTCLQIFKQKLNDKELTSQAYTIITQVLKDYAIECDLYRNQPQARQIVVSALTQNMKCPVDLACFVAQFLIFAHNPLTLTEYEKLEEEPLPAEPILPTLQSYPAHGIVWGLSLEP